MSGGRYAENTTVPVDRSIAEIDRLVEKYGAEEFGYMREPGRIVIMFRVEGRVWIKLPLPLPSPDEERFRYTPAGYERNASTARDAYQRAVRQRMRAAVLMVKARLEAIDLGIETLEQAFMPYLMLPSGQTMAEHVMPQLHEMYETGRMPRALLGGVALALGSGER